MPATLPAGAAEALPTILLLAPAVVDCCALPVGPLQVLKAGHAAEEAQLRCVGARPLGLLVLVAAPVLLLLLAAPPLAFAARLGRGLLLDGLLLLWGLHLARRRLAPGKIEGVKLSACVGKSQEVRVQRRARALAPPSSSLSLLPFHRVHGKGSKIAYTKFNRL